MTRYAIVGSGNVGSVLARLFARAGIEVGIANTRGPASLRGFTDGVRPVPLEKALESDVIVLAIPFAAVEEFGRSLPDWTGRIVVDATNAYYTPNSAELLRGRLSTHHVAASLPGARVVKAFNQVPVATLAAEPDAGRRVVFVATDDPAAGDRVAALVEALGFAAVHLGRIDEGGRLIEVPNALTLRGFVELRSAA